MPMYTDDGARAVQKMFNNLKARLKDDVVYLGQCHVELTAHEAGYTDTAVRESVCYGLAELLWESMTDFGEAVQIQGKPFQEVVARHFVNKEGGFAAMLQKYHGVK